MTLVVVVVTALSLSRLLVILRQDFLGNFGVQGWFAIYQHPYPYCYCHDKHCYREREREKERNFYGIPTTPVNAKNKVYGLFWVRQFYKLNTIYN